MGMPGGYKGIPEVLGHASVYISMDFQYMDGEMRLG
jgi:hypothetical protein